MKFAEVLRDKRKDLNKTQEEMAKVLGLSRPYLADLERGRYSPSLATAIKIAKKLDIDANVLKKNDGNTIQKSEKERENEHRNQLRK